MTAKLGPEALIALAMAALKDDVAPALAPGQRHALALALRALDIARRELASDGETAAWALLDEIYDDGDGSPMLLAQDIRSGKVDDHSHPGLRDKLRRTVVGELKARNPDFLASRNPKK